MLELFSSDFVKLSVPLLAAVVAWIVNERRKRAQEEYTRKELYYRSLIESIQGFYVVSQDKKLKETFLEQLNQCWLYCPDEVILKGYAFLDTVRTGQIASDAVKELACGELIAAIRNDMLSRTVVSTTNLIGKDFRHLRAT